MPGRSRCANRGTSTCWRREAGRSITRSGWSCRAERARPGAAVRTLRGLRRPGGGTLRHRIALDRAVRAGRGRGGGAGGHGGRRPPPARLAGQRRQRRWRSRSARSWTAWWSTRTTLGRVSIGGVEVPPVLLSGDHGAIARWRRENARPSPWDTRESDCMERRRRERERDRSGDEPESPPGSARGAEGPAAAEAAVKRSGVLGTVIEIVVIVAAAFAIAMLVQAFLVKPFTIHQVSMRADPRGGRPHPHQPADLPLPRPQARRRHRVPFARDDGEDLVKRVVGVAGDTRRGQRTASCT